MTDLAEKRALVCGASQGIGAAVAAVLAKQGARVALLARDQLALDSVKARLTGTGHMSLSCDLNNPEDIATAMTRLRDAFGPVAILVCNAGGPPAGRLLQSQRTAFTAPFASHLFAAHQIVQALAPDMIQGGWGRIINIISTSVKMPLPNLGVSNTVRGAVAAWAKTLAGELAASNITVNSVLPGYTATGRLTALIADRAERSNTGQDEVARSMMKEVPMGRFAEAHEVAALVGFLASGAAGYITGTAIPVDGGRTGCL